MADFITKRLVGFSEIIILGAIIGVVLGYFGKYHFLLDLCSHFRFQAIGGLMIAGIITTFFSSRKWFGIGSTAIAIGLLAATLPYAKSSKERELRILCHNVLTSNTEKDSVANYILTQDPDVAVFIEIDELWEKELSKGLSQRFPYHLAVSRDDNFGIACFSKHSFTSDSSIRFIGDEPFESVDVTLKDSGIRIVGTHSIPPTSDFNWQSRNRQMDAIAETIAAKDLPTILCGDFNCSPWSHYMSDMVKTSGLQLAAKGRGLRYTWNGNSLLFALPLDHFLVSEDIMVTDYKYGPFLGSDHLAIIIDIVKTK